jgi:hypothetical protein
VPLVAYTHAGKLVRSKGVEVLDRRDGKFATDAAKSAALRLRLDDKEEWLIVGWTRKGYGVLVGTSTGTTFDEWARRSERSPVELGLPDDYYRAPASLDTAGRLVLPLNTRVLRVVDNPAGVTAPEFSLGLDVEQDGELVGLPGVTVVEQRGGVDVGERFAGPEDKTAVAKVTFEGETWFVLARRIGSGPAEFFPTAQMAGRETPDE